MRWPFRREAGDRGAALRGSLLATLGEATARDGLSDRGRLRWLADHVEHYLERWLAFRAAADETSPPAEDDALFLMLRAGVSVLTEEIAASPAAALDDARGHARRFAAALDGVAAGEVVDERRLRTLLGEVGASLDHAPSR